MYPIVLILFVEYHFSSLDTGFCFSFLLLLGVGFFFFFWCGDGGEGVCVCRLGRVSCFAAQVGLELSSSRYSLTSRVAGLVGMCQHAQLR